MSLKCISVGVSNKNYTQRGLSKCFPSIALKFPVVLLVQVWPNIRNNAIVLYFCRRRENIS